mmetsp:Transcript_118926/g.167110  ORF Transcript_118926/g.167110 Transcript_118926/m.167110 type:complete len:112 (+) Transcript_118926:66-401(+)
MPIPAGKTGDPKKGKKIFSAKAAQCHGIDKGGGDGTGPGLYGVVGREAGSRPGFPYSPANKHSGITWTEDILFDYLENPRKYLPGTKMAFAGIKKAQDRIDLIAYMKQCSD